MRPVVLNSNSYQCAMNARAVLNLLKPLNALVKFFRLSNLLSVVLCSGLFCLSVHAQEALPIADVHVHYSHDSVELTPPERVIELMRGANLKFALVSSSDDNGTQLLTQLAPDLIVPGLRPYRRRGETNTWFRDPLALSYVERLLEEGRYATIGEFHLYGDDADLPIPRRIVQLAVEHNLILHAHSDAEAVEKLLAQHDDVRVIWAHSGFDSPEAVSEMLAKHDRLWADLAFRSEVGSGGSLSEGWLTLFEEHPTRLMLGTDTYTPERMYYLPEHAESARTWLATLSDDLAENIAWKNAWSLLMPVWQSNRSINSVSKNNSTHSNSTSSEKMLVSEKGNQCTPEKDGSNLLIVGDHFDALLSPQTSISVSESFSMEVVLCSKGLVPAGVKVEATMPAHGHGMNYTPEIRPLGGDANSSAFLVDGLLLHMPGSWQWEVSVHGETVSESLTGSFELQ